MRAPEFLHATLDIVEVAVRKQNSQRKLSRCQPSKVGE